MNKQKKLDQYIVNHIDEEDEVLKELDRETNLKVLGARMISGHLQGRLLIMLSKMIQPKSILEIGTFTGYSAICLSKGLQKNGKLTTIEIDDELEFIATKYFKKAGISNVVDQRIGSAIDIIPGLESTFDMVFIDGDKREYCNYFDLVYSKVPSGGYILADNTLWSGKVVDNPDEKDLQTKGVLEFNKMIKDHPGVEKVILPLRDGMTIIRKK